MAVVEVIYNPLAAIGLALIILVSVTAITFLAVVIACGLRLEELDTPEK